MNKISQKTEINIKRAPFVLGKGQAVIRVPVKVRVRNRGRLDRGRDVSIPLWSALVGVGASTMLPKVPPRHT
eukprot:970104-Amorphochlora_amoeboformis.AAC.1